MISLLTLGVIIGRKSNRSSRIPAPRRSIQACGPDRSHTAVDEYPRRKRIGNLEMGWLDSRHSTSRRDYLRDRVSRRAAGETSLEIAHPALLDLIGRNKRGQPKGASWRLQCMLDFVLSYCIYWDFILGTAVGAECRRGIKMQ